MDRISAEIVGIPGMDTWKAGDASGRDAVVRQEGRERKMGGCGGKKQREKGKQKIAATIGGQYNSTGSQADQQQNLALITRLVAEIGRDGERMGTPEDKVFLQDTRIKMNQSGSGATFGWRQVEAMVRLHRKVMDARAAKQTPKP